MKTKRLDKFHPCLDAREWMLTQKNATEAWNNCERGDWMLWIAKKLNVDDRKLTMAKAMCAKQVEHLMKDQRSKDAIQACIDYFNGLITREELNTAYAYAYAAARAAYARADAAADAADAAAYAYARAAYAADAADAAAHAAYAYARAADAADAAADAADADARAAARAAAHAAYTTDARMASLKRSADICREYLTEEVMAKYRRLK